MSKLGSEELRQLFAERHARGILPSRFKHSNFRRFEPVIRRVVEVYPEELSVRPGELKPETFATRLRDSMKLYVNDTSITSDISRSKLEGIMEERVIYHNKGIVTVGLDRRQKKQGTTGSYNEHSAAEAILTRPISKPIKITAAPTYDEFMSLIGWLSRCEEISTVEFVAPDFPLPDNIPETLYVKTNNKTWTIL